MASDFDFDVLPSMQKLEKLVERCTSDVQKAHNIPDTTMDYVSGMLPLAVMECVLADEDESEQLQDDEEYAVLTSAVHSSCMDNQDISSLAQDALVVSMVSRRILKVAFDIVEEKEAFERGDSLQVGTTCSMYDPRLDQRFNVKIIDLDRAIATVQFLEFNRTETVPRELIADSILSLSDEDEDDEVASQSECELCHRQLKLTRHHLIPRVTHRTYRRKGYSRELLNFCAMICSACHRTVHRTEPNQVLAAKYNTVDKLLTHPAIQQWVEYASKIKVRQRR
jgi:hypothetical protein